MLSICKDHEALGFRSTAGVPNWPGCPLEKNHRFPEVPEFSPELTIYLFGVVLSVVESQLTVTGYIHP